MKKEKTPYEILDERKELIAGLLEKKGVTYTSIANLFDLDRNHVYYYVTKNFPEIATARATERKTKADKTKADVLRLMQLGLKTREIATKLDLSIHTVEGAMSRIRTTSKIEFEEQENFSYAELTPGPSVVVVNGRKYIDRFYQCAGY